MKMNAVTKKTLPIILALLLGACAYYPQHYGYYPGNGAYSSGYTVMHRNYYGERPNHYDNGYGPGKAYFPNHDHHDQAYAHSGYQQDRGNDHPFNNRNSRGHDDDGGSRHNTFDRRNHH
jgi:hypothetical protein